ncbi:amidase family protein [Paenibacillus chibensis]|uniref:amidase family protein n=1 Tax=Paenibacillus chibensis TaxID=59846 RepID=UPI000FD8A5DF|nr:amidase family protein [Paenibacillus chibensis]MEC0370180.1 amidase family protein [Paenibacillus chibensis]
MKSFKRNLLTLLLISALSLTPIIASASPAVSPASGSEKTEASSPSWMPQSLTSLTLSSSPITTAEFAEAVKRAAEAAGSSVSLAASNDKEHLTREKAASLLNSAINVPYAKSIAYKDIAPNSPYEKAISNVYTAELMQGKSPQTFGYGKMLTHREAAAIVYRLYQYLQPFQLTEATIADMQKAMETGRLTSEKLVQQYLDRIAKYDHQGPSLNSILTLNAKALDTARQLDMERAATGERSPLHGIPVIVKDNYDTYDMPTTSGNIGLKGVTPPDDAAQVKKLRDAGAIIIGKANLHEFAFGYTTVSSMGGQTLNPYDPTRVPGGSSGGTAAAVAANLAAVGMGTDTGGSIRIPSSFNSLVGIRPTVGLSSRDGIAPLALTQDTGGPIARTVADAALILNATAGYDPHDIATAKSVGFVPKDYTDYLDKDGLKGARIGIVREVFGSDAEVNSVASRAIEEMKAAGAILVDNVQIPNFDIINKYGSLSAWEFKFQFNDYLKSLGDAAPYKSLDELIASGKYDPSIKKALIDRNNRTSLDAQEYKDIVLFRTKYVQDAVLKMMADNQLDALIFPTSSKTAVKVGEEQVAGDAFKLSSFTGWPTVTVPAGFTADHLPVGIDFFGRAFSEPELIKLAYSYEQQTHHREAPELTP